MDKKKIAKKPVKKSTAATTVKTIKRPMNMKIQTAEGWKRSNRSL